jgi:leucyl/phenylalanyl-tRNA--protein transferase
MTEGEKMLKTKVKLALDRIDRSLLKGRIRKYYTRHFKYKGKAYELTEDLFFPPHTSANKSVRFGPAGELLAIGGDLSSKRMIQAYKKGIVPFFIKDEPILWWTSEIRCVLYAKDVHISRSMKRVIRQNNFGLTVDKAFRDVVSACAELRKDYTWLTPERIEAACKLHELGIAHSFEVWQDENLVGGLFGVALGSYVQLESMFARVDNASKFADIAITLRLGELNCPMVDAGIWPTDHQIAMGSAIISREEFLEKLDQSLQEPDIVTNWGNLFENWDLREAVEKHLSEKQNFLKNKGIYSNFLPMVLYFTEYFSDHLHNIISI